MSKWNCFSKTECGLTLTYWYGTIISPGFPNQNYPNSFTCTWLIQLPIGESVKVNFISFELEASFDCLRIYDGNSDQSSMLGKFCGNSLPSSVVSSTNEIFLKFQTDSSINKKGYMIRYIPKSRLSSWLREWFYN